MMKHMLLMGICVLGFGIVISTCDRPTGHIVPLSSIEKADVLAPSVETAQLEARLTSLERWISGTAINNRLDAGDINQGVTPTMRAEFSDLEKEWEFRREDVDGRLSALRHRLHKH